jgi:nucleoside-triphosphatase
VDQSSGPSVGKYKVNLENLDELSRWAFSQARQQADFVIVDEIAPMEVYSKDFCQQVQKICDSDLPLLATIHQKANSGFISKIKRRTDIQQFEVTRPNRSQLPAQLEKRIRKVMSPEQKRS